MAFQQHWVLMQPWNAHSCSGAGYQSKQPLLLVVLICLVSKGKHLTHGQAISLVKFGLVHSSTRSNRLITGDGLTSEDATAFEVGVSTSVITLT